MTKGEAIAQMLRWLDEATINGEVTPADQLADLKERAAHMLDGVVKYIAAHFKIPAVYTVVRAPVKNLLDTGFSTFSGVPPDKFSAEADGGKSFYVEVHGDCYIDIDTPNGGLMYSNQVTYTDGFGVVKANLPEANGERVTISIISDYPFVVRNAAIYPCTFQTDDAVQNYTAYVPYELPDNFREFDCIQQTSDQKKYRRYSDYRREGIKTFLLPYNAEGQFEFRYWRNPADVPVTADDSTVLEVQNHAAQLIPLKLAVDVCLGSAETASIGHVLDAKFQNTLINLLGDDTGEKYVIETVYSMI